MTTRTATCRCGQLRVTTSGEPGRVSVCHCLDCQKRSGSAFSFQARWPEEQVTFAGEWREWKSVGDSGKWGRFRFCPTCGSTVSYEIEAMPGLVAVAVGAFADPSFPAPAFSVWEKRKHDWVAVVGDGVEHWG